MANRKRNLGINIRVTAGEKKRIERNAKKCRLNVSEYLRQIALGLEPKELPSDEIITSLMRLSEVSHYLIAASSQENEAALRKNCSDIAVFLDRIRIETLQLLTHSGPKAEVNSDGDN